MSIFDKLVNAKNSYDDKRLAQAERNKDRELRAYRVKSMRLSLKTELANQQADLREAEARHKKAKAESNKYSPFAKLFGSTKQQPKKRSNSRKRSAKKSSWL